MVRNRQRAELVFQRAVQQMCDGEAESLHVREPQGLCGRWSAARPNTEEVQTREAGNGPNPHAEPLTSPLCHVCHEVFVQPYRSEHPTAMEA